MEINKGDLAIRIGNGADEHKIGDFLVASKTNAVYFIYEDSNGSERSVSRSNFRMATPYEVQMFNKGFLNINELDNQLDNFSVLCGKNKDNFEKYKSICKTFGINVDNGYKGNGTYYGTENKRTKVHTYSWGKVFSSVEKFEIYLNNNYINNNKKENEEISKITAKQGIERKVRAITSSRQRQIANASPPDGDRISVRIRTRQVRRVEISTSAINFWYC